MEETELKKEPEFIEENPKNISKTPTNLQRKAPNEKIGTIIIGAIAGLLILSFVGTFIGASIYENQEKNQTTVPTFTWSTDRFGFYDKDGKFLGDGGSYKFADKQDSADRKYLQITSIEAYKDSYTYVFPSFFNNKMEDGKVETSPIYAVGREIVYSEDFETNFASIKKNVFGFPETNKQIGQIYFQSLYKEIGNYAFYECEGLERVEFRSFAAGKQIIGEKAFAECGKLKDIVFSENLTTIGEKAFENDLSLTTINLPNSLLTIGPSAFKGTSITTINFKGTESEWNKINKALDWSEGLSNCSLRFLNEEGNSTILID